MKITLKIHKALQREYQLPETITKQTEEQPLIKAIKEVATQHPQLQKLLFTNNDELSPLFLLISEGKELKSTKIIYQEINKEHMIIQVIPVYHGG